MPFHDWTQVPSGLFHHFHQDWSIEIARTLNRGQLPPGLCALVEQRSGPREADVLAIESRSKRPRSDSQSSGGLVTLAKPVTRFVHRSDKAIFSVRANRILVKHHLGRIIAVIEIMSPGNKDSRSAMRDFVSKSLDFLRAGIHLLVVDLFPPTPRDPLGIHKLIWDEIQDDDFAFPAGKDRTLVSYDAGIDQTAYVEPIGLGDTLPDMPLFLDQEFHVPVPLESTYQATWNSLPEEMRIAVETGVMPESDPD
ncbi:MAG: DUF4058 family protein [Planctomycetia bacterium]|nr:DUF4058 family protein [Planctomycetia bacterium]